MTNTTLIIYKIKQLGFDSEVVTSVEKYFSNTLEEDKRESVKPLINFIESVLDTSYAS